MYFAAERVNNITFIEDLLQCLSESGLPYAALVALQQACICAALKIEVDLRKHSGRWRVIRQVSLPLASLRHAIVLACSLSRPKAGPCICQVAG